MRLSLAGTVATIMLAVALVTTSGCGVNDSPKKPTKSRARTSAVAHCAGAECRVRVKCKGRIYVRVGPAPVQVRTTTSALRTSVIADFAGSRNDAIVQC
jgi:hypothetical protein